MLQTNKLNSTLQKRSNLIRALIILSLVFLVYIPSIRGGFIWDDDSYVTENYLLDNWEGLKKIWVTKESPQYYPMVFTLFWIQKRLWGLNPLGYHLVNVFIHALNAVLLWLLLRRLKVKSAWFIGIIFGVHPVYVESVAWVTELKNVLSGLFYFSALHSFLNSEEKLDSRWYIASITFFVFALLSKTVTCTLPVTLILIRWWQNKRLDRRYLTKLTPLFAVGLIMGLHTIHYENFQVGALEIEWSLTKLQHMVLVGKILWFYIVKLIVPLKLSFIYPKWQIRANDLWQWIPLVSFLTAFILLWLKRHPWGKGPIICVSFYGITLLPALGFFNVYPMRYSYVADHFQYLASLGIVILIVETISGHLTGNFRRYLSIITIAILGGLTWNQGAIYKDLETLWLDTLSKDPGSWLAHNNLGFIYSQRNEDDKAMELWKRAIELEPKYVETYTLIGSIYYKRKDLSKAEEYFQNAIYMRPNYGPAHNYLGGVYFNRREYEKAADELEIALRTSKLGRKTIQHNIQLIGKIFYGRNEYDKAIKLWEKVLEWEPDNTELWSNLGAAYYKRNDFLSAEKCFTKAIEIDPNFGSAHYNLGGIYLEKKEYRKALEEFQIALKTSPTEKESIQHDIELLKDLLKKEQE